MAGKRGRKVNYALLLKKARRDVVQSIKANRQEYEKLMKDAVSLGLAAPNDVPRSRRGKSGRRGRPKGSKNKPKTPEAAQ